MELTKDAAKQIVRAIQQGRADLVERTNGRVTIWNVKHDGRWMKVVYDRQRKSLVTFLPMSETSTERG